MIETYLEATKQLAKTMVIKSDVSASLQNEELVYYYGEQAVDVTDKRSWKYYCHVSGTYHPTDELMRVRSLDTLEMIEFTVFNLSQHNATREAYEIGSRYYYALIAQYPNQETLINGILYPTDIDEAINAEPGTILNYDKSLVEIQEHSLIMELESWIKGFLSRWDVKGYGMVDEYYHLAQHSILYLQLIPKILNLRLRRCRTNEVHSFHIKNYLASNQGLDRFLPYMTLKQALYLYRNITYIEQNAGNAYMFKELVERILTDRFIPLSEYSVRHEDGVDEQLYLDLSVRRKELNPRFNVPEVDYIDYDTLVEKEIDTTYGNQAFYDVNRRVVQKRLQNSYSSVVQSKDLESSMIDYSNAVPDTLESVLIRQWVMQSNSGLYDVVVNFRDPKNIEYRGMFAKDAFIYAYYIALTRLGIEVKYVPSHINIKYRQATSKTVKELLKVVPKSWQARCEPYAKEMVESLTKIKASYSVNMFFEQASKVYEDFLTHWFTVSNTHTRTLRGYLDQMFWQYYGTRWEFFSVSDELMVDWLAKHNLPTYDYTDDEAKTLIKNIVGRATGYEVDNTKRLKYIQKAMLELLAHLSSYTIQFIADINESEIRPIGGPGIRVDDLDESSEVLIRSLGINEAPVRVTDRISSTCELTELDSGVVKVLDKKELVFISDYKVRGKTTTIHDMDIQETHVVRFPTFYAWSHYEGKDESLQGKERLMGIEDFNKLSKGEKKAIPDIY